MRKLKVYGTTLMVYKLPNEYRAANGNTQKRVVMATTSWAKFAEALKSSVGSLRPFSSITGNAHEIAWCMAHPEEPFYLPNSYQYDTFLPLP